MKQIGFFISILLSSSLSLSAQQNAIVITVDTLSQNVYMLTGQGGNIGIYVGGEHVFMIDDQFDRLSPKIKKTIHSITDKPIAYLFNTHMHGDHTGGNINFNTKETTLIAHENVRKSLKTRLKERPELGNAILPEITFSEDVTLYDGNETIMAFHVHNAHTNGDAMVYFMNNNVLHMGDAYFSGRYPYIDLKNGGSVNGYIAAHKKALTIINGDTKIIPGHGRPSNKTELREYTAMLSEIRENIQKAIQEGKSLEDVEKDNSLTNKYDATHGNGFINPQRIRATFYNSLKNSPERY
ncbi:MBL fold metallo-hydrolase [Maribacter sp. 2304DJ31-5]|uniref:MBL fold metallo-hydrolase n=1 Tax=Maribacter sp. 2304DJ31-5 TaxID=3386273 RepID=UPI0039BC8A18